MKRVAVLMWIGACGPAPTPQVFPSIEMVHVLLPGNDTLYEMTQGTTATFTDWPEGPPIEIVLGTEVKIVSTWSASCERQPGFGEPDRLTYETCNAKEVSYQVRCEPACSVTHEPGQPVVVLPQQVGEVRVVTRLVRQDNGEVREIAGTMRVIVPDAVGLLCHTPDDRWRECDAESVAPASAQLIPYYWLGQRRMISELIEVNGVPARSLASQNLLAALYPQARRGDAIEPGTYPITVEVAGVSANYQIVVR